MGKPYSELIETLSDIDFEVEVFTNFESGGKINIIIQPPVRESHDADNYSHWEDFKTIEGGKYDIPHSSVGSAKIKFKYLAQMLYFGNLKMNYKAGYLNDDIKKTMICEKITKIRKLFQDGIIYFNQDFWYDVFDIKCKHKITDSFISELFKLPEKEFISALKYATDNHNYSTVERIIIYRTAYMLDNDIIQIDKDILRLFENYINNKIEYIIDARKLFYKQDT